MTFTVRTLPSNHCVSVMLFVSEWNELGAAVKQWQTCLHACIKEKGGYFEHSLP